ncbi:MerC domain-containing protein [Pontibacter sp. SGAir0037]|uniref:MerC domain-containing protein n=1 Tax=Pontibacter sp. SGAir0037 TaxID=2571030 RepID=UPI00143D01F3|nr:MerC domain-containing protein [Pontibacter sp. SGAir0037]
MKDKVLRLQSKKTTPDWLGILSAGLCLVHCILPPLLLLLPFGFTTNDHEYWQHYSYAFLIFSFVACFMTTRTCTSGSLVVLFWSFFALLTIALLLHEAIPVFEYAAYAASFGLIGCHLLHIRQCKKYQPKPGKQLEPF